MERQRLAALLLCACGWIASAAAQGSNQQLNATQLTGAGPIYKKQDSLEPVRPRLGSSGSRIVHTSTTRLSCGDPSYKAAAPSCMLPRLHHPRGSSP